MATSRRNQLFSPTHAQQVQELNEGRNQRILNAVTTFLDEMVRIDDNEDFENAPHKESVILGSDYYKNLTNTLDKNLQPEEKIKSGYVFDIQNIKEILERFKTRIDSFGGWDSYVSNKILKDIFEKLWKLLPLQEAQVIKTNIVPLKANEAVCNAWIQHIERLCQIRTEAMENLCRPAGLRHD